MTNKNTPKNEQGQKPSKKDEQLTALFSFKVANFDKVLVASDSFFAKNDLRFVRGSDTRSLDKVEQVLVQIGSVFDNKGMSFVHQEEMQQIAAIAPVSATDLKKFIQNQNNDSKKKDSGIQV